ncbi:methylated-DNA--[protein]-cysteine S-methyltransferase [Bacillus salacetis]|uniref:Methylated-DNA--protein-cysteine methyltransferase n=2 Tax=Bacillus salacetis TaxID=2315464 RepID=A0A3A1QSD0_9BACI|nr:methylated-DNA--[protein]-cysteine S-methyltransferase [Bacillus salacetis]RIW30206.1 methylated-DNA--[protein]-cysteine S-methyltransferase [Bacillus salacetis]
MVVTSPVGNLKITAEEGFLTKVEFVTAPESTSENTLLQKAAAQMEEYFRGNREKFDLPIKTKGTPFQESVWEALKDIPYGSTCSYKQIAEKINNPKAVRAIGQANKSNSLPIIIPCHRVIGKNQSLTGYAGSQVDKKEILLKVEKAVQ